MKTKIIYIIDILWIVGAGLQEGGYLELIPEDKDWLKLVIIAAVLALNAIKIQLEIQEKKKAQATVKRIYSADDSIGGGGIKNPPPPKITP